MITTPVALDACRRCGAPILVGYSEGLLARAGATPLDPRGELDALLAGRWTFDLHLEGLPRRAYLIYRCPIKIQAPRKWNVVAAHKCPPGPHFPVRPGPPIDIVVPIGKPVPDIPPF